MAEYIDREAVLLEINRQIRRQFLCIANVETIIKGAPAVDVAPVVHGRWDDLPNEYMSVASKTGAYHGNATTCSVCHEVNPNAYKTNYCPNCGARMDGGTNNAAVEECLAEISNAPTVDVVSREEFKAAVNELCRLCGRYTREHDGACNGCKWRERRG